ncbi:MAG: hypothetical protein IK130_04735 [Oscillospiraceae bacterium]|nr:hypothetical protein [Oscillospiraceae bacterium]
MTERFDELNSSALNMADASLAHIAETAAIPPETADRIAARTMEKLGFSSPKTKPVIRHTKRPKHIAALVAAVLSAAALAIGVGGYLRYNQRAMEKNFGVLGTAKLADMQLAEPKTFTNGVVNATVEAVLCDGVNAYALTTFKTVDPAQTADWNLQLFNYREKGCPEYEWKSAYPTSTAKQEFDGEAWVTWEIRLPEGAAADTLTIVFERTETDFPSDEDIKAATREGILMEDIYERKEFIGSHVPYFDDLTDGLEIDIPLTVNIPVITLRSEIGDELKMSGFEMISPAHSGSLVRYNEDFRIIRKDGTSANGCIQNGRDYSWQYIEKIDGVKYRFDDPATYIGFVDVTDIEALEFSSGTYSLVDSTT